MDSASRDVLHTGRLAASRWAASGMLLALLAGCGGGDRSDAALADSLTQSAVADTAAAPAPDTTTTAVDTTPTTPDTQPTQTVSRDTGSASPAAKAPSATAARDTAKARPPAPADTAPTTTAQRPAAQPAQPKPPAQQPAETAAASEEPEPAPTQTATAPLRDEYHQAPRDTVSQDVYTGWKQYNLNCARCHGEDVLGTTIAPHLITSVRPNGPINTKESFVQVVCAGRPEKGMPAWCPLGLEMEKITQIYEYVKGRSDGKIHPGRPALREGS